MVLKFCFNICWTLIVLYQRTSLGFPEFQLCHQNSQREGKGDQGQGKVPSNKSRDSYNNLEDLQKSVWHSRMPGYHITKHYSVDIYTFLTCNPNVTWSFVLVVSVLYHLKWCISRKLHWKCVWLHPIPFRLKRTQLNCMKSFNEPTVAVVHWQAEE